MKLELSEKQVKAIIELASKNPDIEELHSKFKDDLSKMGISIYRGCRRI